MIKSKSINIKNALVLFLGIFSMSIASMAQTGEPKGFKYKSTYAVKMCNMTIRCSNYAGNNCTDPGSVVSFNICSKIF